MGSKTKHPTRTRHPHEVPSDAGILDLQNTGMRRVLNVVVGAVIVIVILAALTPVFFDAVADLVGNLTNVTTGDSAADAILVAFAPVIGIIAAVTFLGLVLFGLRQNR